MEIFIGISFHVYDFIVKCPDAVFDGSCRNFPSMAYS